MRSVPQLTAADLRFVAETVGGRVDPEDAPEALRGQPDLLEVMLEDDRLVERLLGDADALLRISPRLVFTVLLRRVVRDLEKRPYTLERTPAETVAVFDAGQVRRFVEAPAIGAYLVSMLSSFVRSEAITLWIRRGDGVVRRRFSTSSLEDMIDLVNHVAAEDAPPVFQRIADIALFRSGIFPDSLRGLRRARARPHAVPPSIETYEEHGRRYYRLAAHPPAGTPGAEPRVLDALADEFPWARKSLEILSERYLRWTSLRWLEGQAG